ncbi:MAG: hypothetical protein KME26_23910 [Oscillatoria princeps RMCB-10]|nr:hypothetical protein [Oscillatoria princeps RMCB-10]
MAKLGEGGVAAGEASELFWDAGEGFLRNGQTVRYPSFTGTLRGHINSVQLFPQQVRHTGTVGSAAGRGGAALVAGVASRRSGGKTSRQPILE